MICLTTQHANNLFYIFIKKIYQQPLAVFCLFFQHYISIVETAKISTQTCRITSRIMKILSFGTDQFMAEYHRKRYNNYRKK